MARYTGTIRKETRPSIQPIADDIKARQNKDYFWPSGTQVYVGRQGSGKTMSAVKHVTDLKKRYPKAILVTNLKLTGREPVIFRNIEQLRTVVQYYEPNQYIYFQSNESLHQVLTNVNNGDKGVIYLIDEIHTYLNAVNSKNTPMHIFTEISQQRKQHKLIISTSQLFMRLEKALREQCDNVIVCSTVANYVTVQKAYDGMTIEQDYDGKLSGQLKKVGWFFHNRRYRNAYDTFQKVVSSQEQFETINRPLTIKEPKKITVFNKK